MGKQKKGRRHRRVNRTPRPVMRMPNAGRALRQPPSVAGKPDLVRPAEDSPHGPEVSSQGRRTAGGTLDESTESVFSSQAEGGLGHPAQRTWSGLWAAGGQECSVEELCKVVGFTPRTIVKHLEGLAAHGLAARGAGGGWIAAELPQPYPPQERALPDPRTGSRGLAGRSVP